MNLNPPLKNYYHNIWLKIYTLTVTTTVFSNWRIQKFCIFLKEFKPII